MRKNKKGFTLIELLAVIVVLGIIMMIAVTSVSGILEKSRRDAFVSTARSLVDAVRINAASNGTFPACGETKTVYLSTALLEKGGTKSPYGHNYVYSATAPATGAATDSIVKIEAGTLDEATESCTYTYSIFLTDGTYAIGSSGTPATETSLTSASVAAIPAP